MRLYLILQTRSFSIRMSFVEDLTLHIENAFAKAEREESNLANGVLNMEGLSGIKTKHFYNNLVNREGVRYLEIGTWKGSSVCSAMCGNKAKVLCIDNWSEFGGPKDEFLKNFNEYKGENDASFLESDSFNVDVSQLPKFNIYMYDGNHTRESHYRALMHYHECLDDIFVFVVDDWNVQHIRDGTYDAIRHLKLTILYEKEIFTPENMTWQTWWNGIYVAILQKPNKN